MSDFIVLPIRDRFIKVDTTLTPIQSFRGDNFYLSNFFEDASFTMTIEEPFGDIVFPSSEHYFMFHKSGDMGYRLAILEAKKPREAKRLGKLVTLRGNWEQIKDDVMYDAVFNKFYQNPDIEEKLLATGDRMLIEGNTWGDDYWGVCRGKGKNMLGKILMYVREELAIRRSEEPHYG